MDETPKQSGGSHAGKTNWLHIANKLNRTKLDCMRKWKQCERALSADTIKKGSFTPEEVGHIHVIHNFSLFYSVGLCWVSVRLCCVCVTREKLHFNTLAKC